MSHRWRSLRATPSSPGSPSPRAANGTLLRGEVLDRLTGLTELHDVLAEWEPVNPVHSFPPVDSSQWLRVAPQLAKWATDQLVEVPTDKDRFVHLVRAIEEKLAVDVLIEERGTGNVAGASVTDPEFSLIFINASQSVTRALFTLAHELGHVLAQDGEFVVDEDLIANSNSERFANAFAGAFLLPEADIREQIPGGNPDARTLCQMLDRYGTSYETLIYRLHNLRIINAAGRDKLRDLGLRGLVSQIDDQALGTRLFAYRQASHSPCSISPD